MAGAINFSAEVLISGDADAGDMVIKIVQVPGGTDPGPEPEPPPTGEGWKPPSYLRTDIGLKPLQCGEARVSGPFYRSSVQDQNYPGYWRPRHLDAATFLARRGVTWRGIITTPTRPGMPTRV